MSSSSALFNSKEIPQTALSTQVHAPSNVGFMHTMKDQFTYFSGSDAGIRETFGMPSAELAQLMQKFTTSMLEKEAKTEVPLIKSLLGDLESLTKEITTLADQ